MAIERDIARLLHEEVGPRDSDCVASNFGNYFFDETSQTEYEDVEDLEEEKEAEKEIEDCDEDVNPPLFDPEAEVLQVSDLDCESATPDGPATLTAHSCDDMRKTYRRNKNYQSSLNMDVVAQIIALHWSVTLT
uniref:Uncharacterized protein n=1 Tax=Amphimedon queenslandica TaxID=400682 RepID=A0A1X7VHM8_AMPQE